MDTNTTLLPGETVVERFVIPEHTSVINTDLELAGEAFIGNLNQEQFGTTVSPAGSGSSSDTFIVDFHAFRTILAVGLVNSSVTISEVYMWLGTNFYTQKADGSIEPDLLNTGNVISTHHPYTYFTEVNTPKIKVILNASMTADEFKNKFEVKGRSFPLNLRAKLGDEDPFWASPGEFSKAASLPPLTETLNRLKSQGNGSENEIPLALISDGPGKVTVRKKEIGFHLEKIQLNENDTAKVSLEADNPVEVTLTSPSIGDPNSQILLEQVGFDMEGVILSDFGVKVSPVFSAAIKIEPPVDLKVQGFKVLLGNDVSPDLELFAEIQADQEGQPFADEVLGSAPIEVDQKTIEQDSWLEVNFEESIDLKTEKTYWLVLKSKTGTAEWKGYRQTPTGPTQIGGFKYTKNAGQTWQDHIVTGYFMLVSDPPQVDNQQFLPVIFEIEGTRQENVYVKEAVHSIDPIILNKQITLDDQGRINLILSVSSEHDGWIQLSKAFIDYCERT